MPSIEFVRIAYPQIVIPTGGTASFAVLEWRNHFSTSDYKMNRSDSATIPPLRGPTRHKVARKRKSGRSGQDDRAYWGKSRVARDGMTALGSARYIIRANG
jgi:hypothetical protein